MKIIMKEYQEKFLNGNYDIHQILKELREENFLGNGYMVYEQNGEFRVAIGVYTEIKISNGEITFQEQGQVFRYQVIDPIKQMEEILGQVSLKEWTAYGYLAFDAIRYYYTYEKKSRQPDAHFFIPLTELRVKTEGILIRSIDDLEVIQNCVQKKIDVYPKALQSNFRSKTEDRDDYMAKVSTLINAIKKRQLTKTILSRAVKLKGSLDILSTYQMTKDMNESARSYAFEINQIKAVGSSPEILLCTKGKNKIETNPLAGTRPRGKTSKEDEVLRTELYNTAKEVREHALAVLQVQEEVAYICEKETTHINKFMEVKPYRCVQHLSSRISGTLQNGKTAYDALKTLFPGVTTSGFPKKEAIKWINELETEARGIYAGTIGWLDWKGNVDLALAIRSVFQYDDEIVLNAAAGIVEESDPAFEYNETFIKMNTMGQIIIVNT